MEAVAVEVVGFEVSQYRIYYAGSWEGEWHAASPATQQRLAEDGKVYTVADFVQHLGGFEHGWGEETHGFSHVEEHPQELHVHVCTQ